MVALATRFQRMNETHLLPVGVFEDDALLLRLAARSRFADLDCPRGPGPMDTDDLAFEGARMVAAATWDL